ncbi:MAG: RsmB/NOP family class I SAM-dependent RNA methyltransferase, partial [Myxococcota bacterium]|nr:RsmB/NOP family class I SAM-dependent RNA methyltransferase [Myxococcota bacterium]
GMAGFAEGRWWVMDPAAAAVADLAVGAAAGPAPRILDACAAPGGKSLRMASRGSGVVAVDQSATRLARVKEASIRTGLPVETVQHDWLKGPQPDLGKFDVVLVDAPCTGLGTIRRHPEIKWRRLPTDPAAMALRQRMILGAASQHVVPGGALVYAVCSPMEEEGEPVVASLQGWHVRDRLATFPPAGDEDAFQAFVLERA